jgi:hypothetical protein
MVGNKRTSWLLIGLLLIGGGLTLMAFLISMK